jgi:hypothetical protein
MSSSPLVLWHASRADIDRPTIAGRTVGENHANSGLGLFCATAPHAYIAGFGPHVHALTIKEDAKAFTLWVRELAAMGPRDLNEEDSRVWFEQEGQRLSKEYDLIHLKESNGNIEQAIILHDAAIVSSTRFSMEEYQGMCQTDPSPQDPPRKTLRP